MQIRHAQCESKSKLFSFLTFSNNIFFLSFLIFSFISAGYTIYFVLICHWYGPFNDFWRFFHFYETWLNGSLNFGLLLEKHANHRLFFPRLLYWIEYGLFDGQNIFLLCCNVGIQLISAVIIIKSIIAEKYIFSKNIKLFLSSLCILLLFSVINLANFIRAWHVQYFLMFASATISFYALIKIHFFIKTDKKFPFWLWLSLVLLSGVIATYSTANGLILWFVLLLLCLVLRLPSLIFSFILGFTLLSWLSYYNFNMNALIQLFGYSSEIASINSMSIFIGIGKTLGNPFSFKHVSFGTIVGCTGIVISLIFVILFLFKGRNCNRITRIIM